MNKFLIVDTRLPFFQDMSTRINIEDDRDLEAEVMLYSNNNDERIGIAYDESKARFRNAYRDYEKAVNLYDKAIKRLRDTQERFHKDDSVLYEVIKEIEADRNISIRHNFYDKSFKPDHITVKEKKAVLSKADSKILEDYGDILSEGTKKKLEEGF